MEKSLYGFIWRHSWAQQMQALALTVAVFPVIYLSLEIPKQIINEAISGEGFPKTYFGVPFGQLDLLWALCGLFLLTVLGGGVIKMFINTLKGVISERLLRRLRYDMIQRTLRFPRAHARKVSSGEIVSMVTAEVEPIGGLMGDALALPVFQGGQMLTIMTFLFVQNPWLGAASAAAIPIQAYIIPKLQRQVSALNKERVREVRRLSEKIDETVSIAEDIKAGGGLRFHLAGYSSQLGRMFQIRFKIFQKKFMMKFVNNILNQLTPFLFFSIGGYLTIQDQLTIGALVAALAAYKDLSQPWRELLGHYTRSYDMRQRYEAAIAQFMPEGLHDEALFTARPENIPRLKGRLEMRGVRVLEDTGKALLDGANLTVEGGGLTAVECADSRERSALAAVLARSEFPAAGSVSIGGTALADLPLETVSLRIGHVPPYPELADATVAENVFMPLMRAPKPSGAGADGEARKAAAEALAAGNSADPADADWLDPGLAGLADEKALYEWWLETVTAIGRAAFLLNVGLNAKFPAARHPELAERLLQTRKKIAAQYAADERACKFHPFDPDKINEGMALWENLLFAAPKDAADGLWRISGPNTGRLFAAPKDAAGGLPAVLARDEHFLSVLQRRGVRAPLQALAADLVRTVKEAFGDNPAEHPLFKTFGGFDARLFEKAAEALSKESAADGPAPDLLALALAAPPGQLPKGPAHEYLRENILAARRDLMSAPPPSVQDRVDVLDRNRFSEGLSVLENLIFGRLRKEPPAAESELRESLSAVLNEEDLRGDIILLIGDWPAGRGGVNVPPHAKERIALGRAAIKKPDLLVLENPLASHEPEDRAEIIGRFRALLPETTFVFLDEKIPPGLGADKTLRLVNGRIQDAGAAEAGAAGAAPAAETGALSRDLAEKFQALSAVSMFAHLKNEQLRLLAFAAEWRDMDAGEAVFQEGGESDAVYVVAEGLGEIRRTIAGETSVLSEVTPGRAVGDLQVIAGGPRRVDFVTVRPSRILRVGAAEFKQVLEHDPEVANALLRSVAQLVNILGERIWEMREHEITGR